MVLTAVTQGAEVDDDTVLDALLDRHVRKKTKKAKDKLPIVPKESSDTILIVSPTSTTVVNGKDELPWKTSICGGVDANGSESCGYPMVQTNDGLKVDKTRWSCSCVNKPKSTNYHLLMAFMTLVQTHKVYLTRKEADWDLFVAM